MSGFIPCHDKYSNCPAFAQGGHCTATLTSGEEIGVACCKSCKASRPSQPLPTKQPTKMPAKQPTKAPAAPKTGDACMTAKWKGTWTCAQAKKYCSSNWSADVKQCCPGTCPGDACLAAKWGAGWKCAQATRYCTGKWSGDVKECCPHTCTDNDHCMAREWGAGWSCSAASHYCSHRKWGQDVKACCPVTCE